MEVREQLERLLRIQEMVDKMQAARRVEENAPRRLAESESRFRERNAEYMAVRERFEALEADHRKCTGELEDLELHKTKYMDDLMQVTNQREYAAMLKEIDTVKAQIAENEETILHDMEEIEQIKTDLASRESHIQEERKLVEKESTEIAADAAAAHLAIAALEEERSVVEADLPRTLIPTVRRLEAGRQGIFLAKAVDGVCQSCYVRVRPQVFQEIRLAIRLHACSSCQRLLYHEPSLRPAPARRDDSDSIGKQVDAINGGAV